MTDDPRTQLQQIREHLAKIHPCDWAEVVTAHEVTELVDALTAVLDLADAFTEFADQREYVIPVSRAAHRRCAQDIRRSVKKAMGGGE